jgi:sulfur relay (sulfurtransferase) DsrC/TusE family protein
MDELEILKKDWKKKENSFNQITEKEIYGMLHKRSSSIVKWIFIISVCEFLLWITASLLMRNNDKITKFHNYDKFHIMLILELINYGILIYFIIKFYKNYRKINTTQPIKSLIKNVLDTRKTVQNYIKIIIIYTIITAIIMFFVQFNFDPEILKIYHEVEKTGKETLFIVISLVLTLIFIGIFSLFVWLFYKLIYGILLKRLYHNYEELKKLEI